jgi:hypothetical protein
MKSRLVNLTFEVELQSGEKFVLPEELEHIGEGRWIITVQPAFATTPLIRNHNAFLNGYAPEDEGLYDDDVGPLTPETQAAISKGLYSAFLDGYAPEHEGL